MQILCITNYKRKEKNREKGKEYNSVTDKS